MVQIAKKDTYNAKDIGELEKAIDNEHRASVQYFHIGLEKIIGNEKNGAPLIATPHLNKKAVLNTNRDLEIFQQHNQGRQYLHKLAFTRSSFQLR